MKGIKRTITIYHFPLQYYSLSLNTSNWVNILKKIILDPSKGKLLYHAPTTQQDFNGSIITMNWLPIYRRKKNP